MKVYRLIAALSFALAGQGFAADMMLSGTYTGGGEWKNPAGQSGTWTNVLTCSHVEERVTIAEALTVVDENGATEQFSTTMTLVPTQAGFYDVVRDEATIGRAYCFDMYCHIETSTENMREERTVAIEGDTLRTMGSGVETMADGQVAVYAWAGSLTKTEQPEEPTEPQLEKGQLPPEQQQPAQGQQGQQGAQKGQMPQEPKQPVQGTEPVQQQKGQMPQEPEQPVQGQEPVQQQQQGEKGQLPTEPEQPGQGQEPVQGQEPQEPVQPQQ